MGSFHIHWSFAILTLTILVTGTSLAAVSLYLARYLRSPAVVFLHRPSRGYRMHSREHRIGAR